ncbi:hypothetical protein ISN45_Aa04g015500, partial [Arabidopsis thaliana x Arabidopsis arenosa]
EEPRNRHAFLSLLLLSLSFHAFLFFSGDQGGSKQVCCRRSSICECMFSGQGCQGIMRAEKSSKQDQR